MIARLRRMFNLHPEIHDQAALDEATRRVARQNVAAASATDADATMLLDGLAADPDVKARLRDAKYAEAMAELAQVPADRKWPANTDRGSLILWANGFDDAYIDQLHRRYSDGRA